MNTDLGNIITTMVTDMSESKIYVQKNGVTYVMEDKNPELKYGDAVEGFAYVDKKNNLSFTTKVPEVRKKHFGWGTVADVRKDLGVFVDIGLPNKDIVVSIDDLPELKKLWPKREDKLYIELYVDEKDRMWGKLADEEVFTEMSKKGNDKLHNKDISGHAYSLHKAGTYIYTDEGHIAFIHESEREREPRLGERVEGRVIGFREEDGVLYASLKPRAYEALDDDAQMVYTVIMKSPTKSIPFTDKSKPEDIKNYFGISKAQFKRAVGRLMKKKLVEQTDSETRLAEKK